MINDEISKLKSDLTFLISRLRNEYGRERVISIHKGIKIAEQIIDEVPYDSDAYSDLGYLCILNKNINQASLMLVKSLGLNGKNISAMNRLATVKNIAGDFAQSIKISERVLEIAPNDTSAKCNLAISLRYSNNTSKAVKLLKEVVQNDANNVLAHYTLAKIALSKKDFATGFKELEWRKREFSSVMINILPDIPMWNGEDLSDKTLIINPEREVDILFSLGFIIKLTKMAKKIILRCHIVLENLMKTNMPSNVEVVKRHEFVKGDFQIMVMSIPNVLKVTEDNIPRFVVRPDIKDINKTKHFFDGKTNKIGLCLDKSNERTIDIITDEERKKAFEHAYRTSFQQNNYVFYSLSTEETNYQGMTDLSSYMYQYDKMASVIAHLDLIIASDNKVAHLAAAMNKETWVITRKMAGWRYTESSKKGELLWYPSVKLLKINSKAPLDDFFYSLNKNLKERFP